MSIDGPGKTNSPPRAFSPEPEEATDAEEIQELSQPSPMKPAAHYKVRSTSAEKQLASKTLSPVLDVCCLSISEFNQLQDDDSKLIASYLEAANPYDELDRDGLTSGFLKGTYSFSQLGTILYSVCNIMLENVDRYIAEHNPVSKNDLLRIPVVPPIHCADTYTLHQMLVEHPSALSRELLNIKQYIKDIANGELPQQIPDYDILLKTLPARGLRDPLFSLLGIYSRIQSWTGVDHSFIDKLVRLLQTNEIGHSLEVFAGNGQFSRFLAEKGIQAKATDNFNYLDNYASEAKKSIWPSLEKQDALATVQAFANTPDAPPTMLFCNHPVPELMPDLIRQWYNSVEGVRSGSEYPVAFIGKKRIIDQVVKKIGPEYCHTDLTSRVGYKGKDLVETCFYVVYPAEPDEETQP